MILVSTLQNNKRKVSWYTAASDSNY